MFLINYVLIEKVFSKYLIVSYTNFTFYILVLKEKLDFLTRFGLLKHIPFLGQLIHDIVEKDPEGVSKALSGGIFAVLDLVLKAVAAGALG